MLFQKLRDRYAIVIVIMFVIPRFLDICNVYWTGRHLLSSLKQIEGNLSQLNGQQTNKLCESFIDVFSPRGIFLSSPTNSPSIHLSF